MYNVIFYKEPTEDGVEIQSVHCETMTAANKLFWRHRGMKKFYYHMPSLCSAISMFENCSKLTGVGFRFLVPVDSENGIYTYQYE